MLASQRVRKQSAASAPSNGKPISFFVSPKPVSYTHLDVYKRQLFILDEVMTGFRTSLGGAQARWGLDPDLTCLGKVIGGGLPVGAYAGKRAIMEQVAPAGPMYQAGTLSGNPLAMTAGLVTLRELTRPGVFDNIAATTAKLVGSIKQLAAEADIALQAGNTGSMFGFYFLKSPDGVITDYASAKEHADTARYGRFFHAMLEQGCLLYTSRCV